MRRLHQWAVVALAAAGMAVAGGAGAQGYPTRPVTLVVPFPAGGSTDTIARIVGAEMSKGLGQQIIVDNKPGANGNVGSGGVAKAQPDGYTLLLTGVGSNAINHSLYAKMSYDSRKDFTHVTTLVTGPNVLVASSEFPAKSLREMIDLAKANPGKYNYASSGVGSSGHLAMEMVKQATGIQITHVPYRGGGPALNDVVSGQVPMMFINQDVASPHVQAGKLRALAVSSLERNPLYPDTPTVAEQGFPGFAAVSWFGIAAPPNTPPAIVKRLNGEAVKALSGQAVKEKLVANGFVIVGDTPELAAKFVADEMEKWAPVVKASGAKLE